MIRLVRAALLALGLAGLAAPALAQTTCPVIPALPDTERRTEVSLSGSTGPVNVGFQIYGDSTDYANWVEVWVAGVKKTAVTDYTVTSPSGAVGNLCRPITDAQVTFAVAQTGTVEIVGARRPRRASQVSENRGVTAHDFNQIITDMTAQLRERWDLTGRLLRGLPGETIDPLPSAAARANSVLAFNGTGQTPVALSLGLGTGSVIGPTTTTVGDLVIWNSTNGTIVADTRTLTFPLTLNPTSGTALTINTPSGTTAQAFNITQAGPTSGSQGSSLFYNLINITDNYGITGGNVANGLTLNLTFGGANTQGSRQGLTVNAILNATPTGSSSFYTGAAFSGQATVSAGGTNTGAGAKGSIVGAQSVALLGASATNFLTVEGHEITITTPAGSTMQNRLGLAITGQSADVQGAQRDEMIALYNIASSVGFNRGLAFDADIGLAPISVGGTAILTVGAQTMNTFIDASSATLTTFLRSNNFVVSGAGNISTVGSINMGAASQLSWNAQSIISSPSDGIVEMTNTAGTGFTRLQLGGTTASFPAIKRNTTALNFRLADDSADADITAGAGTFSGIITGATHAGGSAAGSSLTLESTSSGAPSGDLVKILQGGSQLFTVRSGGVGLLKETNPQAGTVIVSSNTTTGLTTIGLFNIVTSDGGATSFNMDSYNNGSAAGSPLQIFRTARGTAASPANLVTADSIGIFGARPFVNGAFATVNSGRIVFSFTDAGGGSANLGTSILLETTPNGSTTRATACTVQPSGGLTCGDTTDRGIGTIAASKAIQSLVLTVATLPTCNAAYEGARAYVSDQNTAVAYRGAVTGSGATRQAVLCSNSAWIQD